jgi:hypothetical protein
MSYEYRRPRRLNLVSTFFLFVALGAGYAGYKFIPVFWQGQKVVETLDQMKVQAVHFDRLREDVRLREAGVIIGRSLEALHEMGLYDHAEQPVQVWFSPDFRELHARYMVVVEHPIGKPTVLLMNRSVEVPRR